MRANTFKAIQRLVYKKQTHTHTRTHANVQIHIHISWHTDAQNKSYKSLTKGLATTKLTFG